MKRATIGLTILLILIAGAGAAQASALDAGSHEAELDGRDAELDSADYLPSLAHAGADADVRTGAELADQRASVTGPRCDGRLATADAPKGRCHVGEASYEGLSARVGTDVDVEVPAIFASDAAPRGGGYQAQQFAWNPATSGVPAPVVGLAAAAGVVALALLVRAFSAFGGALIPLASRLSDDELLDDENRGAIYGLIEAEPGVSTKELAERLDLAWGTVTHHLTKLEKRRFVVSKKYGKYRRYFVNGGAYDREQKDIFAVLKVERTAEVARIIRENPGISQKEVSAIAGVSSSTVLWHVKRLIGVDLVDKVRDGKMVKYYPSDTFEAGLHESLRLGGGDAAAA